MQVCSFCISDRDSLWAANLSFGVDGVQRRNVLLFLTALGPFWWARTCNVWTWLRRQTCSSHRKFYFCLTLRKFGCESTCETVWSAASPNVCTRKVQECACLCEVPIEERVYECVSRSVALLVSHPAALVHQQRCHVAEQIPALMDESNLLPTQRALLLALQKVLRKIPLHSQFYSFEKKTNCLYLLCCAHTHRVCVFLKTEQSQL